MNRHILIIDDEIEIIELLERFLKPAGFTVDRALSADEALSLMRSHLYNIALCDIRLPDMSGAELIRRLRDFNPLCNIVMITGYTSMDNVVLCLGGGAIDYFTKPFHDMDVVVNTLKEISAKIRRWKKNITFAAGESTPHA